jgi:hypothetical protein
MISEIVAKNPSMVGDTQGRNPERCRVHDPVGCSVRIPALPMALTGALKAVARLNRNTTWVAMGLLGPVIFAAVMVAVRDPHPKTDDLTDVPAQIKSDVLPSANPAAVSNVTGSTEKSTDEITSGQVKSVDFGITPQTNHDHGAVQAIASPWASALQPTFVRVVRPKNPTLTHRSWIPRSVSVRVRLLALWHLSLVQKEALAVGRDSSNSARKKAATPPKRASHGLKGR